MKKLVLAISAILIVLVISSYKTIVNRRLKVVKKPVNYRDLALNGESKTSVEAKIDYFCKHKDEDDNPDIVSVWFDHATIQKIYDLIQPEGADGIRVYYVGNKGGKPFLKTSIIMVSTKPNPSAQEPQSKHKNYYQHDKDNILFRNLTSIAGDLRNDDCDGGALLYKISGEPDMPCRPENEHYLKRSDAEKMVAGFRDYKHSINTISEWFELPFFKALVDDHNDGIRIYFSTRLPGQSDPGRDSFVITTTKADGRKHTDDFTCTTSKNPFFNGYKKHNKWTDPLDNGELCPTHCP